MSATYGNFLGDESEEIVVARGSVLDLLRPGDTRNVQTLLSVQANGAIQSLARLTGSHKDHVVVGSDPGIAILEFNKEKNEFEKIHQKTFGKSGCRRIEPGQYSAVDPKGRVVMILACDNEKLVYEVNLENASRLTLTSSIEDPKPSQKSHTIAITSVDSALYNPIFAAIELVNPNVNRDPTELQQTNLEFFMLDSGHFHVVRKWTQAVDNGANMLVIVPCRGDGPSGVLVCAEDYVTYKNQNQLDKQRRNSSMTI